MNNIMNNPSDKCNVVRTCDVIGKEVISTHGETIGKVEEIVLDKVTGETCYAVLSSGGFLGIGAKLTPIPWKALDYSPADGGFRINIDPQLLKSAPNFDKDHWPDMNDQSFTQSMTKHYTNLINQETNRTQSNNSNINNPLSGSDVRTSSSPRNTNFGKGPNL